MSHYGERARFPALPPRPDSETGEPFPPPGRAYRGDDTKPELDRGRETRLSHKPAPPVAGGPVLVWHKTSKRGKLTLFLVSAGVLSIGFTAIMLFRGDPPLLWASVWQMWVLLLGTSWLVAAPMTYQVLSAGSNWFQFGRVRFGMSLTRRSIKLYELRKINIWVGGATVYLEMCDDTWNIDLAMYEWQYDRRMWDLVYNGILHSVAAGAEVNRMAWEVLELGSVRELRYPDGPREIDLNRLSDKQVRELMDDENVRAILEGVSFLHNITPEQFRKDFPTLSEEILRSPAKPGWFPDDANEGGNSDVISRPEWVRRIDGGGRSQP